MRVLLEKVRHNARNVLSVPACDDAVDALLHLKQATGFGAVKRIRAGGPGVRMAS